MKTAALLTGVCMVGFNAGMGEREFQGVTRVRGMGDSWSHRIKQKEAM